MSDFATGEGTSAEWELVTYRKIRAGGAIGTEGDGRIPDLPSLPKVVPKKYLRVFSFEDARQ